jgi:hypothetical protein
MDLEVNNTNSCPPPPPQPTLRIPKFNLITDEALKDQLGYEDKEIEELRFYTLKEKMTMLLPRQKKKVIGLKGFHKGNEDDDDELFM